MTEQVQPTFSIEKLYVKDLSIEVPNAPQIFFQAGEQPEFSLDITTKGEKVDEVDEGLYNVTMTVTFKADIKERNLFLVEVAQAGAFQIRNFAETDIEPLMMIGCANILFPYAREAVSDAITRAGFPPIHLPPQDFNARYQAHLEAQQAEKGEVQIQ